MAQRKTKMKFKGFEITNAFETNDTLYPISYNPELMDLFFNSILLIDLDKRKYVNDEISFNLLDYRKTSNVNIMSGIFSTARHGVVKHTIDIETQVEIQEITPKEGVKNEIQFTLDKRTGLILIQEDKLNHVL